MRKLAASGKVQEGTMVHLETVPLRLFQEAALVEGKWLDRAVVELAEWGALMRAKGYQAQEAQDGHPLAPCRFETEDGEDANDDETQALQKKAVASLKKFPGKARKIEGRPYLRLKDYCAWKGRKVKADLKAGVQQGFLTASWNDLSEDEATVAGLVLEELDTGLEWSRWAPADLDEELRLRRDLVDGLRRRGVSENKEGELVEEWRQATERFLAELLAFREAVTQVERRYFDGLPLLFPDVAQDLGQVIEGMETLVGTFNGLLARHGQAEAIDLGAVQNAGLKQAVGQMAYLVDMAKAEALEEMGEREASIELAGRYS